MKLHVGMRVVCSGEVGDKDLRDQKGTIIYLEDDTASVQFDKDIGGHSGRHSRFKGKRGHCWNVWIERLTPIDITPEKAFEALLHGYISEEEYKKYAKVTFWQKVKNLLKRRRRS